MSDPAPGGFYNRAMRRIYYGLAMVSIVGVAGAALWKGWQAGAGFAMGAMISAVNFRVLHRVVDGLGRPGSQKTRSRTAVLVGLRYLILGGVAYVIVRFFHLDGLAVVTGFLAAAAAVLIEIVYELIYARA